MLDDWGDQLGRANEVLAGIRRVCDERPGDTASWMLLARALPRSALNEKLAAAARALALDPRLSDAHDFTAVMLASQGRFEAAEAACDPPAFGGNPPHNLRGRAAWLLAERGRAAEAITAMEAVLADHPDYHWGWQQLAGWADAEKDPARLARARAALARLSPNDPETITTAADEAAAAGRLDEALRLFDLASARAPGYPYPLKRALELRWRDGRWDELRACAAAAIPGATRSIAAIYLALADLASGQARAARAALARLLADPQPVGEAATDLADGFTRAGHARVWRRALARAARTDTLAMSYAGAWIQAETERGRWGAWKNFPRWIARAHERAAGPIASYFDLAGDHRTIRHARRFFRGPAAAWCRERTLVFGKIGYALANSGDWRQAAKWLQGAPERDDAEGWLCLNLALALLHLGRDAEAEAVTRTVVARRLRDNTWDHHLAHLAWCEAAAGHPDAAAAALAGIGDDPGGAIWRWMRLLARETTTVLEAAPGTAAAAAQAAAIRTLRRAALTEFVPVTPPLARWHRRALRRMAASSGRWLRPWDFYIGRFMRVR
jgi:cellulose synthase operon protein C